MTKDIYYFSGTGNSYAVARDISQKIDGKLISIGSLLNEKSIKIDSAIIGIIFPRYYGANHIGIPPVVKKFFLKLENIESKYIFVVCTFGGGVGDTFIKADNLLKMRGGKLSAGYGVHMPQNAFQKPWENKLKLFEKWDKKKEMICKNINSKSEIKFEKDPISFKILQLIFKSFVNFQLIEKQNTAKSAHLSIDLSFENLMPFVDNGFCLDENCNGCGICLKVCPVSNIKMIDNRPSWQHHCENCLACFNWCPEFSIHGGIVTKEYHYHHPTVKAKDLMKN